MERALRLAEVPVAFSAGFHPHPKISYAGAAATGTASEAEYLEIAVTDECDPRWVRDALDAALPDGIDVVEVVAGDSGNLAASLEASLWEVRIDGITPDAARVAVEAFLGAKRVEVERLTKKGRRRFDVREPVLRLQVVRDDRRAASALGVPCAILRMIVRNVTPAVRPEDVLNGIRQVAAVTPRTPPRVTRLEQGPWDERAGRLVDPLRLCREPDVADDTVEEAPPATPLEDDNVVGARPPR